ncbi:TlpA family protein disulfide reductase, partial [Trueperella sp.]|uniref:TlpA family protein disulfide reductase n=1 Tax=Trueperella sp. TaxID=2699835 RepID=UPI003735A1FE
GDAPPPEVGQPAPEFSVLDIDGNPVVLDRLDGPTWLIFNATWCSACRAETPDIQAVQDARGDEFNLVSVWVNEPRDVVQGYVDRMGLDYVHVVDSTAEIASTYRTMGVPSHYFIDSDGVLQEIYVGGLSQAQMNEKLDALN